MNDGDRDGPAVVVIGAGPAGLTAAYELVRQGHRPVVVEQAPLVGGLARTESYRGFHFDMGGHRFFTKVPEVERIWREVMGDDFLRRPRLSRIYYDGKFFHYPLRPWNALAGLGVGKSMLVGMSYLRAQLAPQREEETFEQWVTNRFGRRLFLTFFKAYTEKVWGVPCSELKAEWAAQRIKDLSLRTAVLHMFLSPRTTIKTLIEEFDYPRLGPGMMWGAMSAAIERGGGEVRMNSEVVELRWDGRRILEAVVGRGETRVAVGGASFISSMPITELVARLRPAAPPEVLAAAARLTYRDFLTVCLIVDAPDLFPDNWIYIHDPNVRVGRIQNFKNWSPEMVPDPSKTSLGLEYFCTVGDETWRMSDAELVALGAREIERIGIAPADSVVDGCVARVPKAYPIYDADYREHLDVVRRFVDDIPNLQTIGRNGLHRYDNQDHAMVTGLLAVRNLVAGESNDVWSVNTDQEYQEEVYSPEAQRVEEALERVFSKLDRWAFGASLGAVTGVALMLATLLLVWRGGPEIGPHLQLLSQYFPGYRVSAAGSLLGLAYGFAAGFGVGWLFAFVRNVIVFAYQTMVQRRLGAGLFGRFLDSI